MEADRASEAASELAALVRRAQGGDAGAQTALIAAYQKRLGGFVYAMVSDPAQVDDLCQTIFVRMILALPKLRDPERFEAWFFRTARNGCLSYLRREKFRRLFSPLSDDHHEIASEPGPAPGASAEPTPELLRLRTALKTLPPKERALLALVEDLHERREGGDYASLAASLGIGVGALKTRVHRARLNLKKRMERLALSDRKESIS